MAIGSTFLTKLGYITIIEEDGYITNLFMDNLVCNISYETQLTEVIKLARLQIEEYLNGSRKKFNLPLNPRGTLFMKEVWKQVEEIPYGETSSYQDIAKKMQKEKASRAIGLALNKNPIPLIIPCHRVIGKDQGLTGYSLGIKRKKQLLDLERKYF